MALSRPCLCLVLTSWEIVPAAPAQRSWFLIFGQKLPVPVSALALLLWPGWLRFFWISSLPWRLFTVFFMNFLTLVVLTKDIWVSTFHGFHYYKLEIDLSGLTNFHVRSLLFLQFFDKGQFDVFSLKSSLFDWNWKFVSDNSESAVWFVRQDRDGMYVFIFKTNFSIWTQSELCHLRVKVLSWLCSEFESQFKIKTKQRKMEKNQKDVDSTYSLFWNPDSCFVHAWSKAKWLQEVIHREKL